MSRPNAYGIHVDMNRFESRTSQLGLRYLHSIGSPIRDGVKVAIACLYSPLGAAVEGQSLQRVRLRIGASRGSFEAYMALATSASLENLAEFGARQSLEPKQNIIKTTLVENKPAGLGAKYLNCGVIEPGAGVELAIICLYGPLGTARRGGNRSEVDAAIAESRQIFEKYMDLTLQQFVDDDNFVRFSNPIVKTIEDANPQSDQRVITKREPAMNSVQNFNDSNREGDDEIDLSEEL